MTSQALILAGGRGSRLGGLTQNVPKPMISVSGLPFLERLVTHLTGYGIDRFVLCIGYLGDQIRDYFGGGEHWNCRIQYSVERELLGTGGAIKHAASLLDPTFFVMSGDNYLELDYRAFDARFDPNAAVGMLACWRHDRALFQSNLRLSPDRQTVAAYNYRDPSGMDYVDSGVKIFSHGLFDYFDARESFSLEVDVLGRIASDGRLAAYAVADPPLDVGTPAGLENVRRRFTDRAHIS